MTDGLPRRVADWPPEWRYRFEERAGILEYEAGITRHNAEREAEAAARVAYAKEVRDGAAAVEGAE